jgi:hypothetical protein
MTVKDIVLAHLKSIGADGLCGDDCGCGLKNLMWCDEAAIRDCVPARHVECKDCKLPAEEQPDSCEGNGAGCYQALENTQHEIPS